MSKKLFYRIGEACKLLDIQPYVLRYWETEFPVLQPRKSKAGQRVYSEEELQLIQRIKQLLYEEGYTIAGAKKKLEAELAGNGVPPVTPSAGPVEAASANAATATPPAKGSASLHEPARATPPPPRLVSARVAGDADHASASHDAALSASDSLDSPGGEQVERLRAGLQEALAEAREILRLLSA